VNKKYIYILFIITAIVGLAYYYKNHYNKILAENTPQKLSLGNNTEKQIEENPLSIISMRKKDYPVSELVIEQTLPAGTNYIQYIASYKSDGLKIYGLLTIPTGIKPKNGWPVIIFNHGYIPPDTYKTTERYVAYVAALAKNGYIVYKPDYRGHGNSEGQPEGAYYSPSYAIDTLNALSSLKRFKEADPERIGMWGHSMGGNIISRDIVVDTKDMKLHGLTPVVSSNSSASEIRRSIILRLSFDKLRIRSGYPQYRIHPRVCTRGLLRRRIKAAVIWGGVVGTYNDLMNNWQRKVRYQPSTRELSQRNNYRKTLTDRYGTPDSNSVFWNSIDPTHFLTDVTTPIQLHTGGNDEEVPVTFSVNLKDRLEKAGKYAEYYNYPGGDHNISSPNFELAMQRSIDFFNKYLKGGEINEK